MTTHHDEEHRRSGGLRGAVNELFGRADRDDTRDDDHLRHEGDTVRPDSADRADRTDPAYADDPGLGRDQAQYAGDTRQAQYGDAQYEERSAAETTPNAQHGDAPMGNPVAPQGQYAGEQQTTYGGEMRGDTATEEQVRRGGDPTAQGQVQHGGEFQGDPNLPGQTQYATGQAQDTGTMRDDVRGDVRGDTRDDVNSDVHSGPQGDVRDHIRDDLAAGDPATASTAGTAAGTTDDLGRDTQARDAGATPVAAGRHEHAAGASDDDGERAQLVAPDRAESYGSRWDSVKGEFVDEPRRAVADADALVGELLDELQELFRAQRAEIEHGLDNDEASTEDLRVALRRYRSFFDRLLSI